MSTKAIQRYLQTAYSDEKLAALLAHAEDGKLSYASCSCLIGAVVCDHSLHEANCSCERGCHNIARGSIEGAETAEDEFFLLGDTDTLRRASLIPLIHAEFARREAVRNADTQPESGFPSQHVENLSPASEKVLV